jgi:hypothetical protein
VRDAQCDFIAEASSRNQSDAYVSLFRWGEARRNFGQAFHRKWGSRDLGQHLRKTFRPDLQVVESGRLG